MRRTELINKVKRMVSLLPDYVSVWLYGSEARGEAREDSDVDLLVLVNKDQMSFKDRIAISKPFFDIELETGIHINPYIITKKMWDSHFSLFTYNVNKDKVAI